MIYDEGGFIALGSAVGFIAWRFIKNLSAKDYTVGNIGTTLGIVVGGVLTKYIGKADTDGFASYCYGLVLGIIVYNVWGVVWRKMLNDKDPEVADLKAQLKDIDVRLKDVLGQLKEISTKLPK